MCTWLCVAIVYRVDLAVTDGSLRHQTFGINFSFTAQTCDCIIISAWKSSITLDPMLGCLNSARHVQSGSAWIESGRCCFFRIDLTRCKTTFSNHFWNLFASPNTIRISYATYVWGNETKYVQQCPRQASVP